MTKKWHDGAKVVDLSGSRGNGPFRDFRGVILHVNVDRHGTPDSFWRNNPGQVTPNFQVYKSAGEGGVHQMLPFDWQPWCQKDGNFQYAAIETAGMPDEMLTDYQLNAIAAILRVYRDSMGMRMRVVDAPGEYGFGTHVMGGSAWGGHSCPGVIRAAQRSEILARVKGANPASKELTMDDEVAKAFADIKASLVAVNKRLDNLPTKQTFENLKNDQLNPTKSLLGKLLARKDAK